MLQPLDVIAVKSGRASDTFMPLYIVVGVRSSWLREVGVLQLKQLPLTSR